MSRRSTVALLALPATSRSRPAGAEHIGDITPVVSERVSGTWILNVDESDDPAEAMRGAAAEGRGERPGEGAVGRMPPGGGRGGFPAGCPGGGCLGGGMRRPSAGAA